jgi:hypothetical protein
MRFRYGILILILIILAIVGSACSPDAPLPDGEDHDPLEVESAISEEGQAVVYYHYQMKHEHLNFNIETELPVTFMENNPGSWVADAMGETEVTFNMMAAGGESGQCQVTCNVILRMVGDGPVELVSENNCQIPMSFQFVAGEDWILESDCPLEAQEMIDCAAMSLVMADPGQYKFSKPEPYFLLQKNSAVTQEAEIRNVTMPSGIGDLCGW